ncbi:MAG: hypothetical protein HUU35_19520 [Armatimonadetes bacterium]|nr:hypothetical protein [Armatimonadota bacterium]
MVVLDYGASFITFVTPGRGNEARIQVDARCLLSGPASEPWEAWLVASCKAEHTYAEQDLFSDPNYDFAAIFSTDHYRIIRTGASVGAAAGEAGRITDRFEEVRFDLVELEAEPCEHAGDIVSATLAGWPLVAQNELYDEATGLTALLEYPVRTMNVNPSRTIFQTDTGPLLFPEGSAWERDLEGFALAFAAFNRPDQADFILRRPTELAPRVFVEHYAERLSRGTVNRVVAVQRR